MLLGIGLLVSCAPNKIKVAHTVYPVEYLIDRIGGDRVETIPFSTNENVMRSTLVDHYIDIIKEVDTIFTIGGLEPYLDLINEDIQDYNPDMYDLGSKAAIVPFFRHTTAYVDNISVEVDSRYYDNPLFDHVDTYINDPYIWLDPIMMTSMANEILSYFIEKDPQNQAFYESNFDSVKMDLANLDANYAQLKSLNGTAIATMIPAFGRYANNYGLRVSPIILSKYGNLPTDEQLEIIKSRLLNDGVRHIIVEHGLDKDIEALAESLAKELNLEVVYIDSLTHRTALQVENGEDYLHIMNQNLAQFLDLARNNEEGN